MTKIRNLLRAADSDALQRRRQLQGKAQRRERAAVETPLHRPFVIPVFIPNQGCPHRCVFCNQAAISGTLPHLPGTDEIRDRVRQFLPYCGHRRSERQIAFFGGNFLGLPAADIATLLEAAERFVAEGVIDGIRFSTRPDTIDNERLDRIARFPVTTVELGVQSMEDHVLGLVRRGHSAAATVSAVAALRERGYRVGCQIMVGLPGEDAAGALAGARRLVSLAPDFVRIYPTVVLAGSRLAEWHRSGRYIPLPLEDGVDRVKTLYLLFADNGIRVIRMGLQAAAELDHGGVVLAGPYHPAFGHLVFSRIFLERAVAGLRGLTAARAHPPPNYVLRVHPRDESRMRGLSNGNIRALKAIFPDVEIRIQCDDTVDRQRVEISAGGCLRRSGRPLSLAVEP